MIISMRTEGSNSPMAFHTLFIRLFWLEPSRGINPNPAAAGVDELQPSICLGGHAGTLTGECDALHTVGANHSLGLNCVNDPLVSE